MQPVRVSSYWTLFLKIFIPTVWIVFFGAVTIFVTVLNGLGNISLGLSVKAAIIGLYAIGFVLLYISFLRLKRVEMTAEHFFVTNYFKTFRYTYQSLKNIKELDFLIMQIVIFEFVEKSAFGKKVFFVRRRKIWNEFVSEHPDSFAHLISTVDV